MHQDANVRWQPVRDWGFFPFPFEARISDNSAEPIDPPGQTRAKKVTPIRSDLPPILPEEQPRRRRTLPWAAVYFTVASIGWVAACVANTLGRYHWNFTIIAALDPYAQLLIVID